jgi:hypothetical protein
MAMALSVTVSIGELTTGMFNRIRRVRYVPTSTWDGKTSLKAGSSKTSSNVIAWYRIFSGIWRGPFQKTGEPFIIRVRRANAILVKRSATRRRQTAFSDPDAPCRQTAPRTDGRITSAYSARALRSAASIESIGWQDQSSHLKVAISLGEMKSQTEMVQSADRFRKRLILSRSERATLRGARGLLCAAGVLLEQSARRSRYFGRRSV